MTDGNENGKKKLVWINSKTTGVFLHVHDALCTFLCRWPAVAVQLLHNSRKNSPILHKIERQRMRAMIIETAWSHFLSEVLAPSSSLLKLPNESDPARRGTLTCVLSILKYVTRPRPIMSRPMILLPHIWKSEKIRFSYNQNQSAATFFFFYRFTIFIDIFLVWDFRLPLLDSLDITPV